MKMKFVVAFMDTAYENLTIHGHGNHEIFLCLKKIVSAINYPEISTSHFIAWILP